jgi:hypothetical protein
MPFRCVKKIEFCVGLNAHGQGKKIELCECSHAFCVCSKVVRFDFVKTLKHLGCFKMVNFFELQMSNLKT